MGLDIAEVRRQYPTLQMIGGIDKYSLALGREAIDVSWDNYRYFGERLRDLIERYPPDPRD